MPAIFGEYRPCRPRVSTDLPRNVGLDQKTDGLTMTCEKTTHIEYLMVVGVTAPRRHGSDFGQPNIALTLVY